MKSIRIAALALGLAAAPALAAASDWSGPVNAGNQDAHLETLFTSAGNDCVDEESFTNAERVPHCLKAIEEISKRRAALKDPSPTELANHDFYESHMQIALSSAYVSIDGEFSKRGCTAAERSWELAFGMSKLPEKALAPHFADLVKNPPEGVDRVLGECRGRFGKPANGAPLPAEQKKK